SQCIAALVSCFFFQAEDGIRDGHVTGVQTCALPISGRDSTVPGPQGVPGENGRDATISIGTVTSGPASVTVRVENGAHVLDFVLPQGKTGASEIGRAHV